MVFSTLKIAHVIVANLMRFLGAHDRLLEPSATCCQGGSQRPELSCNMQSKICEAQFASEEHEILIMSLGLMHAELTFIAGKDGFSLLQSHLQPMSLALEGRLLGWNPL